MTTSLDRGPAPVTVPAKSPRRRVTALFALAAGVAAYTGFRLPGEWAATLQSVSLTGGFHRRFLVGTLLSPFGPGYRVRAVASFLVLAALLTAVAIAFFRGRTESRRLVVVAWLLLPTGGYLFHEVGYFDQVLYVLLFAALWASHRNRPVVASALMTLSVAVHEIALLTVLPVFGFALLRKVPSRRACVLLAPPAVAGLVILALPPAAPGAVDQLRKTLSTADFPYRADALSLFDRTQAQSWQLYSVTNVLLYLVPIAILLVGGFLVLHRPTLAAALPAAAIAAPALLAFGGWDDARWGFLLVTNFALVLWLCLGGRELSLSRVGVLSALLLVLTHVPMPYFDGCAPRGLTLVTPVEDAR
ncbi:Permease of the drug/metabolite transporter (DMT) superfamily [Amycolatopsis camponoti]|uniref:Permease of the drug/metabolite transporter (DMT) superfamily n=1 Tax=Amycolatopsis camponoti TaxID=2606593 RepID=A0A6I8LRK2_9PSEU|nr:hypothetical protein [Amycolatopsis camponoti]VVJ17709.1 Permease of the drug/metabolite transporter (DMT) superfamily [Amycolatopsis camponoti]